MATPLASSADWSCGRSDTPPSLPANSPPPLPEREDLDFVMDQVSSSSSSSASPTPLAPGMTDVVEINDKESVEDGEVVRRRTIITLGPRVVAPSGGSSSSINVTLLNGPVDSSSQPNLVKRYTEQPAEMSDGPRMPGSALSTPVVPSNNDANCSVSHVGTTAYGRHSQDSALIDVPLRRSFRCRSTIPSPTRPSNTDQQRRAGGRKRGTNVPNLTAPKQLISSRVCSTLPAAVRTCLQLGSSIARSTVSAPPSAPRPAPLRR